MILVRIGVDAHGRGNLGAKMGAGDGAAEQARLAAERVAKLRSQLDNAERAERAWAAGAEGEARVSGVVEQCAAVAALLEPQHRRLAQGWLCMVQQPTMRGIAASGARIEGLDNLRDAIGSLPAVLAPETVEAIHDYLKQMLAKDTSPALLTTKNLPDPTPGSGDAAGPAAALEHWRRAQQIPIAPPVHPPEHPPARRPSRSNSSHRNRSRRNRGRPTGCLGVLLPLVLTVFFLGVFLNVLSQLQQPATQVPRPTPSVVKTVP